MRNVFSILYYEQALLLKLMKNLIIMVKYVVVYDYYCLLHVLWFVYLCGDVVLITIYLCMMCWYVV